MDRRKFVHYVTVAGASGIVLKLTGCGMAQDEGASHLASDGSTRTVLVYDLTMEGWSTLGSGFLGDNGILRATTIRDFDEVTLDYVQDPHGHRFTITEADFAKVLLGQTASILTTYALNHRHEVRIKPSRRVRNAQPIEVVIDENGRVVDDDREG